MSAVRFSRQTQPVVVKERGEAIQSSSAQSQGKCQPLPHAIRAFPLVVTLSDAF